MRPGQDRNVHYGGWHVKSWTSASSSPNPIFGLETLEFARNKLNYFHYYRIYNIISPRISQGVRENTWYRFQMINANDWHAHRTISSRQAFLFGARLLLALSARYQSAMGYFRHSSCEAFVMWTECALKSWLCFSRNISSQRGKISRSSAFAAAGETPFQHIQCSMA